MSNTGPESIVTLSGLVVGEAGLCPAGDDDGQCASVPAATAPAATTASTCRRLAEAGLRGGAVSGEHGELLAHVRGLAVGTGRVRLRDPDELLEVRLALHAHVLVDRHRLGSVVEPSGGYRSE